jgi:hypothetical protein
MDRFADISRMRSTRALFASIGASISLVAAAALALLTVSAVVALEGWPGLGESKARPALVVDGITLPKPGATASATPAVVLPAAPRPRPRPARVAKARKAVSAPAVRTTDKAASRPPVSKPSPAPDIVAPVLPASTSEPSRPKLPAAPKAPSVADVGDGVREAGEGLSATVQSVGKTLNTVAAPLAPPVGQALEDLTKLVAALLQKSTNLVGGTLNNVLGQR